MTDTLTRDPLPVPGHTLLGWNMEKANPDLSCECGWTSEPTYLSCVRACNLGAAHILEVTVGDGRGNSAARTGNDSRGTPDTAGQGLSRSPRASRSRPGRVPGGISGLRRAAVGRRG